MTKTSSNLAPRIPALVLGSLLAFSVDAQKLEIRGRVLGEGGRPLAEVELLLLPQLDLAQLAALQREGQLEPAPAARARSAPDGTFRLLAPEAGFWGLLARHPAHLETMSPLRPLLHDVVLEPVELLPRREVTVHIVASDGTPLSGIAVAGLIQPEAWDQGKNRGWWLRQQHAISDTEGRVRFDVAVGKELSMAALSGGRFGQALIGRDAGDAVLKLDRGLVDVRLLDPANHPLVGATAVLASPFLALSKSDSQGILRLPDLPSGSLLVILRGIATETSRDPAPGSAAASKARTLHLPATETFDFEVIDALSGESLAGAFVWGDAGHQRSDARGHLRLELAPALYPRLHVAANGYLAREIDSAERPPGRREPIRVALLPAVALGGRVLDRDGEPVANAEVKVGRSVARTHGRQRLPPSLQWFEPNQTTTDSAGRFVVSRLPSAIDLRVEAKSKGFAPRRLEIPPLEPGAPTQLVEITLERGIRAFGRMLDEQARPIAGAELSLVSQSISEDDPAAGHQITTNAEGRFTFDDLAAGFATLTAKAAGFAVLKVPGLEIVPAEGPVDLGILVLERGLTLTGRVVDTEGRAIAGARAQIFTPRVATFGGSSWGDFDQEMTTDAEGRFRFETLPESVGLQISAHFLGFGGWGRDDVRPALQSPLLITLEPIVTVNVLVVDRAGNPVAGADIILHRSVGAESRSSRSATNAEGRRLYYEAPGEIVVSARGGPGSAPPRALQLTAGMKQLEVRLELLPAASLTGRVIDKEEEPIVLAPGEAHTLELVLGAGGTIEGKILGLGLAELGSMKAWADNKGFEIAGFVRYDGSYRIEGLSAGLWKPVFETPHLRYEHPEPVTIRGAGDVVEIDLSVGPPLRGRVLLAGKPASHGLALRLTCKDHGLSTDAFSQPDGSFFFGNTASAACELSIRDGRTGLLFEIPIDTRDLNATASRPLIATDPQTGTEVRIELDP